ncbi:energy-coupling factor transporter transmembrane protein EcfT [Kineosporia sp. R_H_3]|uniref:energy-coupling factor transporter transmembrane component T family protein n=1 Tax=Kineosporia sp. R_H_3 TaxID=1961848 RepID=UPI000B4B718B|nr:energy-coupling factor transporter transmembrane component T [Kineosporia sp. R_H_3]
MTATALDAPVGVDLRAPVARANPVAKLAVASLVAFALLLTVDPVTAGAALGLELLALPWCGVGPRGLLRRGWVLLAGAVPAGVATALLGVDAGAVLVGAGPVTVTEGSLQAGVAISLRVLAIGLPGVVLLATTDPTDLADALAQRLRLPHRFVLSALAAMRLFGVLAEEWQALTAARRARGLGDGGPVGRVRDALARVFALLVLALRRATVLATTMESRGFGAVTHRTWARPSRFGPVDAVVVAGGITIAVAATAAGVAAGTWELLLG